MYRNKFLRNSYRQIHIHNMIEREKKPTHMNSHSVCCVASDVDLYCGRMHPVKVVGGGDTSCASLCFNM